MENISEYNKKILQKIESKFGKFIGTITDNIKSHDKITVKCIDEHEFKISVNNLLRDRWCPHCKLHMGEILTLYSCEHLFNKKFKKCRPEWLRLNKQSILELDVYNEELKLAVEFNGIQHYIPGVFMGGEKGKTAFERQQEYDKIKVERCKANDIILIIVAYTIKYENICQYIADESTKMGFKIINPVSTFDLSNIKAAFTKMGKVKEIIKSKNGEFIHGIYLSQESPINIKCEKGHIWETSIKYIVNGSWCHICGTEVNDEKKKSISEGMKQFLQTDKGKENKKKSHGKRSETMAKQREEIRSTITEKQCSHKDCLEIKSINEFGHKSDSKDGYQPYCKTCVQKAKLKSRENKGL
jgi:hypothetical protein